jgi:PASTA domain-containing protein
VGRGRPFIARLPLALAGALAALALTLPSPPAASAAKARTADSFVDSVGVNVHLGFFDTPYHGEFETVRQRLLELGVRHVRDELTPEADEAQYEALNELAAAGIRSTLILGDPGDGLAGVDALVDSVAAQLPGAAEAVEGPNEYSTRGGSTWKEDLVAYQERLYEAVKDDPALASLPVIGPSIVHGDQAALGDVSAHLDYGNIHSYPEGNGPEHKMGSIVQVAKLNSGPKPIMATETGYTTALGWTPAGPGENRPISEEGMAVYMPRLFFEYFSRQIVRTFSYELLDEFPNPALDDREDHFGLLRNDLSPKPAFTALRNTIDVLEDPGPDFAPGALDYALLGSTANLHRVLLQKRDGTFYLALWRIASVWDPVAKEALAAPSEPVTLQLPAGTEATALYEPGASPDPVPSFARSGEPTVEIGPEVAIVALSPAVEEPKQTNPTPPFPMVTAFPEEGFVARCVVPSLRGRSLKVSRKRLARADCRLGRVRGRRVGTSKVKRQSPAPGTALAAGARVSVKLG